VCAALMRGKNRGRKKKQKEEERTERQRDGERERERENAIQAICALFSSSSIFERALERKGEQRFWFFRTFSCFDGKVVDDQ